MNRIIIILLSVLGSAVLAPGVLAAGPVGTVQFLLGEAWVEGPRGVRSLEVGDAVHEGDRITTGDSARVMLRMQDDALISVHPESELMLRRYHYSAQDPSASQVNVELARGSVRSVTGRAGQGNKDGFRLTTPLVAIGIRGTDFVVMSTPELSRAALISGAIAVVPVASGCSNAPAYCDQSVQLDPTLSGFMVEYRSDNPELRLVPLDANLQAGTSAPSEAVIASLPPAVVLDQLRPAALSPTADLAPVPAQPATPRTPAFVLGEAATPPPAEDYAPVLAGLDSRRVWIDRDAELGQPGRGVVGLALQDVQIQVSGQAQPVQGQNAQLTLDFDQRDFATQMTLDSPALPAGTTLQAQGFIRDDGRFYSNQGDQVAGALARVSEQGLDAAYLFDLHRQGLPVTGGTVWQETP